MNNVVTSLTTWDPDGAGPQPPYLVAGGSFTTAGGVSALRLAKFDGLSWTPIGTGMNNVVWTLGHWNPGTGDEMIVGGDFTTAGGTPASGIARWNGTSFQAFGSGTTGSVRNTTPWDPDGPGPTPSRLVASGLFTAAGGNPISRVAYWDGSTWQAFGAGLTANGVYALATFDPDFGGPNYPQLVVGGDFTLASGQIANRIAAWVSHPTPVIITNPSPVTVCATGTAVFNVRAAAGAFPSYQWRRNGVNLNDGPTAGGSSILGSHSIQLTISSAMPTDEAGYDVVITTACGNATSFPATLQICYANCDCSSTAPNLNVADFTCFLQRFASGAAYANCDLSTTAPTLNVADFTCFLQRFAAGCP
jgi:hypothetical protein